MKKEDIETALTQLRSGAKLDFICERDNKDFNAGIYTIVTNLLKFVQAYNTNELHKKLIDINKEVLYCIKCQRGTQTKDLKNSVCPLCFNVRLKQ